MQAAGEAAARPPTTIPPHILAASLGHLGRGASRKRASGQGPRRRMRAAMRAPWRNAASGPDRRSGAAFARLPPGPPAAAWINPINPPLRTHQPAVPTAPASRTSVSQSPDPRVPMACRHETLGAPRGHARVSPMCPDTTVTHLPGLDPLSSQTGTHPPPLYRTLNGCPSSKSHMISPEMSIAQTKSASPVIGVHTLGWHPQAPSRETLTMNDSQWPSEVSSTLCLISL